MGLMYTHALKEIDKKKKKKRRIIRCEMYTSSTN